MPIVETEFDIEGTSSAAFFSQVHSISDVIRIIPPTLPPDFCPTTWQELVDLVFAGEIVLPSGFTQIIISANEPAPEDRDKIWFKIDETGRIIGIFSWSNSTSSWLEYNPKYIFYAVNGLTATDNADVLTTVNGTQPLATGQWFYWKHAILNTGAVTATINGSAAINVVRPDGTVLIAGEVPADWSLFAFYDGTNLRVISPLKFVVPAPPVPVPPNIVSPVLALPAEYNNVAGGGTALDPDVTWAHGLVARPSLSTATFVCYVATTVDRFGTPLAAGRQSVVGTTVPIDSMVCIRITATAAYIAHPYSVWSDDTNVYLKYGGVATDDGSVDGLDAIHGGNGPQGSGKFIGGTITGGGDTQIPDHWKVQFTIFP